MRKRATVIAIEFGEKLLVEGRLDKLNPRRENGVYTGVKATSGEVWAATKEGLQEVRSVRRIRVVEWWNDSNDDFVEHVLWNKRRNHMEIFQGRLKGQQLPGRLLRGRWIHPRVIVVNTKELHHENSAAGCRAILQGVAPGIRTHQRLSRVRFRDHDSKDEHQVARIHR